MKQSPKNQKPNPTKNKSINQITLRFQTWIGPIIVFVNPYDKTEVDEEKLEGLRTKGFPVTNDAHIYSLAGEAYRDMVENGINQSIIITGESGAGLIQAILAVFLTPPAQ